MTWPHGEQTPDNNLMRFVSRRGFVRGAEFLDIGCGEGANLRKLQSRGFEVTGVDIKPWGYAHDVADIREYKPKKRFDLIYDVNTLCHVEDPPIEKIKGWLKPNGYFFLICPTERTWPGVSEGKEFTRLARHSELRDLLSPFSSVEIYEAFVPDFRGNYLDSWIAEARP